MLGSMIFGTLPSSCQVRPRRLEQARNVTRSAPPVLRQPSAASRSRACCLCPCTATSAQPIEISSRPFQPLAVNHRHR